MTTQHTYKSSLTLHLHDGDEYDFDFVVGFSFTPGAAATGPSYSSGGDPGYGPEVEIDSVRVFRNGAEHMIAHTIWRLIEADSAIRDALIETAEEDQTADRDHYAELEADERRLGR